MEHTIFHVDMDAFYASIEQRDNAQYRGKPVIVGSDPKNGRGRGVVAACSYEARKFGIHSALPISQAFRLCPRGIYLRPDMERYRAVSAKIRAVFCGVTPLVEPLSIDEAFLDVTEKTGDETAAIRLAESLKRRIHVEEHLTASIGIAPNKFLAKIASDLRKPNGLVFVRPGEIQSFLDPLPIARIWGVGPRTEERLKKMGIHTVRELRCYDPASLTRRFGKLGEHLVRLANGVDNRSVLTSREAKSIGHEHTFSEDVMDADVLLGTLERLSSRVAIRLERHGLAGHTVCLKLRYSDFTTLTRQKSFRDPVNDAGFIKQVVTRVFHQSWDSHRKLRLIGVSISSLEKRRQKRQLRLF